MGKLALVALVGNQDNGVTLNENTYLAKANLNFFYHNDARDVSLHAFIRELKKLKLQPSETAMDLLIIACTMYAADTRIERGRYGEDSWTRLIDLFIPVSNVDVWNAQKQIIEKIFRFLTGDIWSLNFRKRANEEMSLSPRGIRKSYGMPYETDTVCLFSGGMDSFIGAVDLLAKNIRPLLVGHSKSADVSPYQDKCEKALNKTFPSLLARRIHAFIKMPKKNLFGGEEHTERGRSFMFLTLGAICASSLGSTSKLYVPENGMISLNIPLTPLRIGSHSTRTTHPHYFSLIKQLYNTLGLGVEIINPYQFKTKGEMLKECANPKLIAETETMSCSHPSGRWEGLGNGHCGSCVPCIIRDAALKHAGLNDGFPFRRRNIFDKKGLKISRAEGADVLAFKYMIEKVKNTPTYLTASIRNTGPLGEDVTAYVSVYKKSLDEVADLLKNVKLI